jgi:hypothetical protein
VTTTILVVPDAADCFERSRSSAVCSSERQANLSIVSSLVSGRGRP